MSYIWLYKFFKNSLWQKRKRKNASQDKWLKNTFNTTKANFLVYKTLSDQQEKELSPNIKMGRSYKQFIYEKGNSHGS